MALGRMLQKAMSSRTSGVYVTDGSTWSTTDPVPAIFRMVDETGLEASKAELIGLPAVYRAINFLAGTAGMLPLRAHAVKDDRIVRAKLFEKPSDNYQFTQFEWNEYELRSRLCYGNSYAWKIYDGSMTNVWPTQLMPIHPGQVTPYGVYGRRGELVDIQYVITPAADQVLPTAFGDLAEAVTGTGIIVASRRDIFHVPGQMFDGVQGYSPIDVCRLALLTGNALEESGARFFGKGSQMGGFLATDRRLTMEEAQIIKDRWQRSVGGVRNSHEVAVLGFGMSFQPITVKPQEAQFIETMRFSIEQVARIFGVPAFVLMDSQASTAYGTSLEQQLQSAEIYSLNWWLRSFEDRATLELLPATQYARFDRKELVRSSIKDKTAADSIDRTAGIKSINEIRKERGLPPIDDERADDPFFQPSAGPAADEPGGNPGTQGGGDNADLGETSPEETVEDEVTV